MDNFIKHIEGIGFKINLRKSTTHTYQYIYGGIAINIIPKDYLDTGFREFHFCVYKLGTLTDYYITNGWNTIDSYTLELMKIDKLDVLIKPYIRDNKVNLILDI